MIYICQTCIETSEGAEGIHHASDCDAKDDSRILKLSQYLIRIMTKLNKMDARISAVTRDIRETANLILKMK
jgi:hypothetical protein